MCAITLICRRTSGVTQKSLWESIGMEPNQSKPSKSIRMKANNFHYVVKTLQSQGLIVGKQAIVKSNDVGGETEYDSRDSLVVSTNLLYLSRYAKELNMNSYQRIEIAKPKLGRDEEINIDALQEDENLSVDYKSYVSIHDYLPAMKAICDKLEEASGKVNSSLPFVCVLLPPFQIIRRFDFFGTSILLCI
jgi:general transcription factor 3C polypeptide 1